jgi:hypothetical protein
MTLKLTIYMTLKYDGKYCSPIQLTVGEILELFTGCLILSTQK